MIISKGYLFVWNDYAKERLSVSDSLTIDSTGAVVYAVTLEEELECTTYKAVLQNVLIYYP